MKGRGHLGWFGIERKLILWIIEIRGIRNWTGLKWLRIGSSAWLMWILLKNLCFKKCRKCIDLSSDCQLLKDNLSCVSPGIVLFLSDNFASHITRKYQRQNAYTCLYRSLDWELSVLLDVDRRCGYALSQTSVNFFPERPNERSYMSVWK
jgi:hypothetical protein